MSAAPIHQLSSIIDASGVISTDLPCRRCSYNLRGLMEEGRCPECGTPIGLSTQGDLLRFASPNWVETLARGIRFILWGIVLVIFGSIGAGVLASITSPILGQIVGFAAGLLSVYGSWLLTEPDPSGLGEDQYGTARKIIRFSLIVGLGESVAEIILSTTTLPPSARILFTILGVITALVGLVGQFALLYYLQKLAMRIPDLKLAGRARFLMYAYGISLAVVILAGASAAILGLGGASPGSPFMAIVFVAGIAGLAMLVFGIMWLFLLSRMGKAFRQQAQFARQTWAASGISAGGAQATPQTEP